MEHHSDHGGGPEPGEHGKEDRRRVTESGPPRTPVLRAAARGVVGAMAMSGMRRLASGLGLVRLTPPEAILQERVPQLLRDVPPERRAAVLELAHWSYGAAAGIAFALLPARLRRWRLAGPVYGVLSWAFFDRGVAPVLQLAHARQQRPWERTMLLVDHILYGAVIGSPPESGVVGDRPRRDPGG